LGESTNVNKTGSERGAENGSVIFYLMSMVKDRIPGPGVKASAFLYRWQQLQGKKPPDRRRSFQLDVNFVNSYSR